MPQGDPAHPLPAFDAPVTPLPTPRSVPGMLLVGGLFDPPHRAHVALAQHARDRAMPPGSWIVFVPAARSPLKDAPCASDTDRLEMLRLATRALRDAAIWIDELDRSHTAPGPSYWIDTLQRAKSRLAQGVPLRFLIGADQAAQFHRWRAPREILAIARPIIIPREPFTTCALLSDTLRLANFWSADELAALAQDWLDSTLMHESSTDAREALRAARAPALDPLVLKYIQDRNLYR